MSIWLWIVLGVLGAAIAAAVLVTVFRSRNPVRRLIGSGVQGLCALAAVNVAGAFTGVSLGLGLFSGIYCILLGVPGVLSLLVVRLLFGL